MKRELGIFERAQLISDRHSPFHIVGVLQLENAPPSHIIRKALGVLQKRHPFLCARLLPEKGHYYLATLVEPPIPFRNPPRWNDNHWQQVVEVELATRIDAIHGPVFRSTYLYGESQPHAEIIFTISHFIADAISVSHLLHELMTICASLADGMPVSVSELSPAPVLESRFPSAFRGWSMALRTVRYILAQMGDEITYRIQTRGKRTPPLNKKTSRGHTLSVQIPEDIIEPFAQRARKEGVTLNSALNAALLLAVNRHLYDGEKLPMRTFYFADMRPYVDPPLHAENLSLYITMTRCTVNVAGEIEFWSLARDLHAKIYEFLKSGDKFVASVMAESLMKMVTSLKAFRLCASALNYNGVVPVQARYGRIKVIGVHGFVSAYEFGPEMASQAQYFNKQLFWDFIYLEEDMDQGMAKAVVEEIKGIMRSVIASTSTSSV
jgi:hypothetical protein